MRRPSRWEHGPCHPWPGPRATPVAPGQREGRAPRLPDGRERTPGAWRRTALCFVRMSAPVIVDAARTAYGKRGGALAGMHAVDLLGRAQRGVLDRLDLDPGLVDEVIGGCVTQAGEQSNNVSRFAWLHAGFPETTGATTIDAQCGSAQQAVHLLAAQIAGGLIDVGLACGVESMSRVPLLSNLGEVGRPRPEDWKVDLPAQFEAADRIAERRGLGRERPRRLRAASQQRARAAWDAGRLDRQIVPVTLPDGSTFARDEGLRETSAREARHARPHPRGRPAHRRHLQPDQRRRHRGRADERGACPRARPPPPCEARRPDADRRRDVLPARRAGRGRPSTARPAPG